MLLIESPPIPFGHSLYGTPRCFMMASSIREFSATTDVNCFSATSNLSTLLLTLSWEFVGCQRSFFDEARGRSVGHF